MNTVMKSQTDSIKFFIISSDYLSDFLKRILCILVDKSQGFTRGVCLRFTQNELYSNHVIEQLPANECALQLKASYELSHLMNLVDECWIFSGQTGIFTPSLFIQNVLAEPILANQTYSYWLSREDTHDIILEQTTSLVVTPEAIADSDYVWSLSS